MYRVWSIDLEGFFVVRRLLLLISRKNIFMSVKKEAFNFQKDFARHAQLSVHRDLKRNFS